MLRGGYIARFGSRRLATFRVQVKSSRPQTVDKFVDLLYEVSQGEIRFIFKRLTDIVYEVAAELPSVDLIPSDLAFKVLRRLAEQKLSQLPLTDGTNA